MAVIAPNSEIYLIKCPIELDNLNQLSFANATAQHNYFNGLPKLSLTNATFQRKDGTIRWPGSMESIIGYNYCMYRNKNHGNKWFYAFIDNMEYVSDNMTAIKISTDVWQTWQFDITFKASYIEREHTNDDTVGSNTLPESLELGEFVCNGSQDLPYISTYFADNFLQADTMVCLQLTTTYVETDSQTSQITNLPTVSIINGVAQATQVVAIPYSGDVLGSLYAVVGAYDGAGKKDAILSVFLAPKAVCEWTHVVGTGFWYDGPFYLPRPDTVGAKFGEITITRNTAIDGYQPKNNKLFVSPFNYIHASNNSGQDVEFFYENFLANPIFDVYGCLDQGADFKCAPRNSKKSTTASSALSGWNEGLNGGKLPTLAWSSDYYLNWQAHNGKNIAIQTGLSALGFATNTITGGLAGGFGNYNSINSAMTRLNWMPTGSDATKRDLLAMGNANDQIQYIGGGTGPAGSMFGGVFNFASQVANTQNAVRNAKMVPPQAQGNTQIGNLQVAMKRCKFTFYKMSIKAEVARCIDNYFSMFGYKTNRMKVPNITGRANWNYVKTVGCNIIGDIPQGDLQAIKAMFNNGITIWHNSSTYLDYSQNNNII